MLIELHPKVWTANPVVLLRIVVVATALGALALAAPLIWAAALGGVGFVALGSVALLGVALAQSLPFFVQKLENRLLAMRKAEAQENPIEQLQNFLIEKSQSVQAFKHAVAQIGVQIASLDDMIEERKRIKPAYDLSKQERSLRSMREAHSVLTNKYQTAEKALAELRDAVEDKKFEQRFGLAGQEALSNLNAASGPELPDQMLADEASASVRANFHQVFAELEMEAAKLSVQGFLTRDDRAAPKRFWR